MRFSVEDRDLPMVSLHVPAHHEPPGMVIDTLGLVGAVALLRRGTDATWRDAVGYVTIPGGRPAQPGEPSGGGPAARWLGTCCCSAG